MKIVSMLLLVSMNSYALPWDGNKQLNKQDKKIDQYLDKIEALIKENNQLKIKLSNVTSDAEVKELKQDLQDSLNRESALEDKVKTAEAKTTTYYNAMVIYETERAPPTKGLEHYVNNCMALWTGSFDVASLGKAKLSCDQDAKEAFAEFRILKTIDKASNWKQLPDYRERQSKFEKLSIYFKQ